MNMREAEKFGWILTCEQWVLSCPTFANPRTVAPRHFCPWKFPGKNTGVGCHSLLHGIFSTQGSNPCLLWVKVAKLCPTLCNSMDYTVDGILQARILEWVAFPFSMKSSQSSNQTQVSHITGRFFTIWATREGPTNTIINGKKLKAFSSKIKNKKRMFTLST